MRHADLVVRNTFIDAVLAPEDDGDLARTQSDPTGGRSKAVEAYQRVQFQPRSTAVVEASAAEEAGEDEIGDKEGSEADEDENSFGALQRTKSHYAPVPGLTLSPGSRMAVSLSRLVPEAALDSSVDREEEGDDSNVRSSLDGLEEGRGMASSSTAMGSWPNAGCLNFNPYLNAYAMGMGYAMYPFDPLFAAQAASAAAGGYPMPSIPPWVQLPGASDIGASSGGGRRRAPRSGRRDKAASSDITNFEVTQASPIEERDEDAECDDVEEGSQNGGTCERATRTPATSAAIVALDGHPPLVGALHTFHQETKDMGNVSADMRRFTKVGYEGRLSVVSESVVHTDGVHRYLVQFTSGELSRADGVGFVFSHRLPCAKNIQRIVSIFVNQRGRICMRIFADIVRASAYVKPIELGDWVELIMDLDEKVASFRIWDATPAGLPPIEGHPLSRADFSFGHRTSKLNKLNQAQQKQLKFNTGHLACVVKNIGVTVTLAS